MLGNSFEWMAVGLSVGLVWITGMPPAVTLQQSHDQQQTNKHQRQAEKQRSHDQQQTNKQQRQAEKQRSHDQQQTNKQQRQAEKQQRENASRRDASPYRQGVPEDRRRQLINQQQERSLRYRDYLDQQQQLARENSSRLREQRRNAQFRYQQEYLRRIQQQQIYLQRNAYSYNYDNDPFFRTAPNYRYNRDGRYYETNQYGVDLLRQAVNNGYGEGFRAGQADRRDRWSSNYEDCFAYRDANFGYNGFYVERDDYNYYFREGFRRGYADGYDNRHQYGRQSNGKYIVLGAVLGTILLVELLR